MLSLHDALPIFLRVFMLLEYLARMLVGQRTVMHAESLTLLKRTQHQRQAQLLAAGDGQATGVPIVVENFVRRILQQQSAGAEGRCIRKRETQFEEVDAIQADALKLVEEVLHGQQGAGQIGRASCRERVWQYV